MKVVNARNVNDALFTGAKLLRSEGVQRDSRNGPVLQMPTPVTTVYSHPHERVLLHPGRDANPFFHLIEALWMVAGRDDLASLTPYVSNMKNFSDDGGKTQPGAYGKRWRYWFARDQIFWAINRLKADCNDRRVVIQMYDAVFDQHATDNGGKDIPCNLMMLPSVSPSGLLDLTVFNRSNDMVFGAYGANAVHFSVIQEVIAAGVGCPMGSYYQVSNNFHGYLSTMGKAGEEWPWGLTDDGPFATGNPDPYEAGIIGNMDIFDEAVEFNLTQFTEDVNMLLFDPYKVGIRNSFLRKIAQPMIAAHRHYKMFKSLDGINEAREILQQMPADNDWRAGAELWFKTREEKIK